ncbi:MAG: ribosome small subunit-dependent GTPase A [Mycobacteriales bacterium]
MFAPSTALLALGYDAGWARSFLPHAAAGRTPGRVARVDRVSYDALTDPAGPPVRATLDGSLLAAGAHDPVAAPTVGDWVGLRHWPDGRVTVEAVLPRRTVFVRGSAGADSSGQVLAANVDIVFVVAALTPVPNLNRLERLLTLAWESGGVPVVVLTKADLASDADLLRDEVAEIALGADVLAVSAVSGAGMAAVQDHCAGRTVAMVGSSGAGKSTLANRLLGAAHMVTAGIRDDGKGRHTTTHRELLPLPGGGVLIDTPGLRGVQLWSAHEGLEAAFADIEGLASRCRFLDCGHATEPDCAVQEAVRAGVLSLRRLEHYRKLGREAAWAARRTDARARAEDRARYRVFARARRQRGGRP